jgi:hypothetical protein
MNATRTSFVIYQYYTRCGLYFDSVLVVYMLFKIDELCHCYGVWFEELNHSR